MRLMTVCPDRQKNTEELLELTPLTTGALDPDILRTKRKVFNGRPTLHVIIKPPRQQIQGIRNVDFCLDILPHSVVVDEISNRPRRRPNPCRTVEDQIEN